MTVGDRVRHMDGREGVIQALPGDPHKGGPWPLQAYVQWESGELERIALGYLEPIEQPGKVTP